VGDKVRTERKTPRERDGQGDRGKDMERKKLKDKMQETTRRRRYQGGNSGGI
jgi:hypothetical protein